jgi:hypothetical protein
MINASIVFDSRGARVAQWVRSLDLTTHTSARLCKLQKGCTRLATASDKVYQLLAHGLWFSPASSTTKTDRHDIAEILLKVVLKRKKSIKSINLRFTATDYPFKFLQINFMFNLRDTEGVICIILSLLKTVDGHNHLNIQLIYVDLYNCGLYSLFCSCIFLPSVQSNQKIERWSCKFLINQFPNGIILWSQWNAITVW